MQMGMEFGFWIISIWFMLALSIMAVGYTIMRSGRMYGSVGQLRYATFGVMSFIFIGILVMSYIAFLYIMEGLSWSYPIVIGQHEFDLANGFWTVFIGASVGVFTGLFALLKKREWYGR